MGSSAVADVASARAGRSGARLIAVESRPGRRNRAPIEGDRRLTAMQFAAEVERVQHRELTDPVALSHQDLPWHLPPPARTE